MALPYSSTASSNWPACFQFGINQLLRVVLPYVARQRAPARTLLPASGEPVSDALCGEAAAGEAAELAEAIDVAKYDLLVSLLYAEGDLPSAVP